MSDSFVHITAFPELVSLSCYYDQRELRRELKDRVQSLLHIFIKSDDPRMQELLPKYGEYAYDMFQSRLRLELYQLPELLVQKVIFKTLGALEKDGFVPYSVKFEARKLWDDIANGVWKDLRDPWLTLKPGARQLTSKQERARMLAFYYAVLPTCQEAKKIYKQIFSGKKNSNSSNWKSEVKKQFPNLDNVIVNNLPDHKPSQLAELQTGRYFHKVIGKDFKGLAEVRRQLRIARKEAET